ncbi:cytochrome c oxidase assembly protein COX16 homolog, mitochondrial [Galleria mellonella]|uniref:Cytochrome c oxidase assembly protein COX16 homolog, mitochondrial n=1 Tax=Galleria mellonella TaxID=7137 RepID=A0A6J1WAH5_GALME|nr:cytochrome c oxidase assembly protein COX16 homolog, mitochondrial [Galleria mellonella]
MSAKESKIYTFIESLRNSVTDLRKKKSFKYGLPFLLFVLGGSFGLREWTQIRYQFSQVKGVSKQEAEKMGLHRDKNVTLEDTYDEIQKLDIDNWENKRGPRPWEANNQKT